MFRPPRSAVRLGNHLEYGLDHFVGALLGDEVPAIEERHGFQVLGDLAHGPGGLSLSPYQRMSGASTESPAATSFGATLCHV